MRWLVAMALAAVTTVGLLPVATPAGAEGGLTLTFATFNVSKVTAPPPAPPWEIRRERLARVIAASGADVLGLQEATWQPTAFAKKQVDDIANLIRPAGYVSPTLTRASQRCAWTKEDPHKCTHTAALFFRSSTIRQAATPTGDSAGVLNEGMIVGGLDDDSSRREVAWAYLQAVAGGPVFLALSVHTSPFKDPDHEAGRVAFASALGGWVDAWNAQHGLPQAPVVLMADLNSFDMRQPAGAQQVLRGSGWIDAAGAPSSKNDRFSTINVNTLTGATGWPQKPYLFRRPATRIDYVFGRGNVVPISYEVVMYLNPDGTFNPDYQASDHQMVRAVLGFPTG